MSSSLYALNAVDAALLGLLGLSVLIGLLRGLLFEVMSLAGWLMAYAVAYLYSPVALQWLPAEARLAGASALVTPGGLPLLAFVLTFFAVLIAWGVLAQLMRVLLRATPLSGIDRVLGAVFRPGARRTAAARGGRRRGTDAVGTHGRLAGSGHRALASRRPGHDPTPVAARRGALDRALSTCPSPGPAGAFSTQG